MRHLLLFFLATPLITFSQQKLDFRNIKIDSTQLCKDYAIHYTSSVCPAEIICNSKNELEIRFDITCGLVPCARPYILSFNGKGWEAFFKCLRHNKPGSEKYFQLNVHIVKEESFAYTAGPGV